MDWLTLDWLMKNLEWAVAILLIGCVILFFFPVLLGWQLKQDEKKKQLKTNSFCKISRKLLVFNCFCGIRAKTNCFLQKRCEKIEKHIYTGKSGFRKLRWGPLDSAERCVLKS